MKAQAQSWCSKARGTAAAALATTLTTVLGGCHPVPGRQPAAPTPASAHSNEDGYMAPPQVIDADPASASAVVLHGRAVPGALISLQAPEGGVQSAQTRRDGSWVLRVPAVDRPRMFALSERTGGRAVHAEGALIVLPKPGPSALLARSGFGALIMERPGGGPTLATIDYDPGGFAAFSGSAPPRATVRLSLDGAPAGVTQADPMGRYAVLAANHRLSFGPHIAVIDAGAGETRRDFQLTPPGPLSSPYQAVAEPGAWRIEWATPGGGVQTTLALAP